MVNQDAPENSKWVIVYKGNAFIDTTLTGLFDSIEEAIDYAENTTDYETWEVVELFAPVE